MKTSRPTSLLILSLAISINTALAKETASSARVDRHTTQADSISTEGSPTVKMYNPLSINPTPEEDVLFGKKIWHRMQLQEKANRGFFAPDREITKWIVEGVKDGKIIPYKDEAFEQPMTQAEFTENLKLPEEDISAEDKQAGFEDGSNWGDKSVASREEGSKKAEHFFPREISTLMLGINYFFDQKRCKIINNDIEFIKIVIPANKFPTGLRKEVAVFKYKDLVAYFNTIPEKAVWKHPSNNRLDLSIPEAFALGKFSTIITKVENSDGHTLEDIHGSPEKALRAAEELKGKLRDDESFLYPL